MKEKFPTKLAFMKHAAMAIVLLAITSCVPKNVIYFQDRFDGPFVEGTNAKEFKLRPGNQISIYVKSRNTALAQIFNMGSSGYIESRGASSTTNMNSMQNSLASYTVDDNGEIDFPIIGKLHIAGMNRMEVAELVTKELRESGQVEDAVVTVQYLNLYVNVLGEMGPVRYPITQDRFTIIDLVTEAGDVSFEGKKKNIMVMREENGKRVNYTVDMTSLNELYNSPVYYVHPDDLVYAEPTNKKVRESTINGNFFLNYGFWLGMPATILSLWVLFFK